MSIQPKSLYVSLHKRSWSWLWFVAASFALAILIIKPSQPAQWLVTLVIVAPTVWLVFVGPSSVYNWQINHRYSIIGWGIFAVRMTLFFLVIKFIVPSATTLVGGWFYG